MLVATSSLLYRINTVIKFIFKPYYPRQQLICTFTVYTTDKEVGFTLTMFKKSKQINNFKNEITTLIYENVDLQNNLNTQCSYFYNIF
jgi:hypothetical protein